MRTIKIECELTCSEKVNTGKIVMINLSPSVKTCLSIPCLKKLKVSMDRFLSNSVSCEEKHFD